ncbi:DUF1178 family protein [Orrella marina]|uniref:DUF1178 domain-containing protein n=1 Tax=Orrella marina TaxID=2163011 RepID=A0A2R4XJ88_9BURK|nr:DUF1178 family protein [Orrella marina]AWB33855.1 DUF1178 domain-containing protein [Orrella marina]
MGLKVFNLQCETGHLFEGWFGSHEDYGDQHARGLIECPVCQSSAIEKLPSAPRINKGRSGRTDVAAMQDSAESGPALADASQEMARIQAQILQQVREYVSKTEDVGVQFAQEARRIHEGEAHVRPIRGLATAQERDELAEDGITVMAVPEFLNTDRLN